MNFRLWWRSAITGRYVKQQEAKASPDTTVGHKVVLDSQEETMATNYCRSCNKPFYGQKYETLKLICDDCIKNYIQAQLNSEYQPVKSWDGVIWYPLEKK